MVNPSTDTDYQASTQIQDGLNYDPSRVGTFDDGLNGDSEGVIHDGSVQRLDESQQLDQISSGMCALYFAVINISQSVCS